MRIYKYIGISLIIKNNEIMKRKRGPNSSSSLVDAIEEELSNSSSRSLCINFSSQRPPPPHVPPPIPSKMKKEFPCQHHNNIKSRTKPLQGGGAGTGAGGGKVCSAKLPPPPPPELLQLLREEKIARESKKNNDGIKSSSSNNNSSSRRSDKNNSNSSSSSSNSLSSCESYAGGENNPEDDDGLPREYIVRIEDMFSSFQQPDGSLAPSEQDMFSFDDLVDMDYCGDSNVTGTSASASSDAVASGGVGSYDNNNQNNHRSCSTAIDPELSAEDLTFMALLPSDIEAALQIISRSFVENTTYRTGSSTLYEGENVQKGGFKCVFGHMLNCLLDASKTSINSQIDALRASNEHYLFIHSDYYNKSNSRFPGPVYSLRDELSIVHIDDYLHSSSLPTEQTAELKEFLKEFFKGRSRCLKSSIPFGSSSGQISEISFELFVNKGYLYVADNVVYLSHPRIYLVYDWILAARLEILRFIKKRTNKDMYEDELTSMRLSSSPLSIKYHLYDLVGKGFLNRISHQSLQGGRKYLVKFNCKT